MKKLLLKLILNVTLLIGGNAYADDALSAKDICSLLNIRSEIFIFGQDGFKILYQRAEKRDIRFGGISNEKDEIACEMVSRSGYGDSNFGGQKDFNIVHQWSVLKDGKIKYNLTQFEDKDFKKAIKKETGIIKDMNLVSLESATHHDKRVVIRFIPFLKEENKPEDFVKLPIVGDEIVIYDNEGNVWIRNFSTSGSGDNYLRLTTHKGTLLLSYYPFKGSKLIGHAKKNNIHLNIEKERNLTMSSKSPFVPGDIVINIYGIYEPKIKTKHFGSIDSNASNTEENFLKGYQKYLKEK